MFSGFPGLSGMGLWFPASEASSRPAPWFVSVVTDQMVGVRRSPGATTLGCEIAYLLHQPSPAGPADKIVYIAMPCGRSTRWLGPAHPDGCDVAASLHACCRGSRSLRPRASLRRLRLGVEAQVSATSLSDVSATPDIEDVAHHVLSRQPCHLYFRPRRKPCKCNSIWLIGPVFWWALHHCPHDETTFFEWSSKCSEAVCKSWALWAVSSPLPGYTTTDLASSSTSINGSSVDCLERVRSVSDPSYDFGLMPFRHFGFQGVLSVPSHPVSCSSFRGIDVSGSTTSCPFRS